MSIFSSKIVSLCSLFIIIFYLMACSESPEDMNEDWDEQVYDDGRYEGEEDYSPADDGWRPGTLKLKFLLKQSSDFHEKKYDENTKELSSQNDITWTYELTANLTQKLWVAEDLSLYMPDGSDEERFEAMKSSPYLELDDGGAPVFDGLLKYTLDAQYHSPNDIRYTLIDKKVTGSAVVDLLTLDDLYPSLYGQGYQFNLKVGFDYQQTGRTIYTATSDGSQSELDESAEETTTFNFNFYPKPNATLNDYPYLVEYQDIEDKNVLAAQTKYHIDWLAFLQKIFTKDIELITEYHTGAITEKSKDKLVVEYQYTDNNKLLPFIANVESLAATPDSNLLSVRIVLSAD